MNTNSSEGKKGRKETVETEEGMEGQRDEKSETETKRKEGEREGGVLLSRSNVG